MNRARIRAPENTAEQQGRRSARLPGSDAALQHPLQAWHHPVGARGGPGAAEELERGMDHARAARTRHRLRHRRRRRVSGRAWLGGHRPRRRRASPRQGTGARSNERSGGHLGARRHLPGRAARHRPEFHVRARSWLLTRLHRRSARPLRPSCERRHDARRGAADVRLPAPQARTGSPRRYERGV